jgi:hypothetical protein
MKFVSLNRETQPHVQRWLMAISLIFGAILLSASCASAEDDSIAIFKAMSDYVTGQKTISLTFDTDLEVVTPELQKIQFSSSGQAQLNRPDKLRASRTGGYADVELVFDGKTATIFGKNLNAYTQLDSPGSIDQLINRLNAEYSVELPGADLLLSNVFDALIANVLDAKHIGRGVIDGVECEHLAFRNEDTDWQIWIEIGPRPIPRKYVITSKTVTGAPQYVLRVKEWKTDAQVAADTFTFKPPASARSVDLAALSEVDELPHGVTKGAQK